MKSNDKPMSKAVSDENLNGSPKIGWHQGFYSGIELELNRYKDSLRFETEYELSRNPMRIDMLVIRMDREVQIDNSIGAYFKKHNIVEYKSPDAEMSIDDFYKTIGYTAVYKGLGKKVNDIPAEDITITMVRHRYPRKLFKELEKSGAKIIQEDDGIYRIEGLFYISTHIIVTSRLSDDHPGLKILSRSVERDELSKFIAYARGFKEKGEKELINSILEVSTRANKERFEDYKEDDIMGEALRELMREEIEEGVNKGRAEGRAFILEALVKDGTITIERARELEKQSKLI